MAPLQEQIQSINERTRAFGIEAIQEADSILKCNFCERI